ncbi:DUF262 domain-containing protein [Clostridium algidicarnis]|uniref:DUF262 domain-containing protein n=1 Tax=Clostridium algidicarnis TaxID=37659 RepID=UPI001C0C2A68|nr:DUF262 domain-containing protein [Clostridium algidicarnis]MBU3203609.1 DUF262 domain-containing protein [Clostridium algidicarnis]MBU3211763.1 DUF262 domain-containing protein [Clostridium algidicarnis]MBU3221730.1 DUF262 domain-containing protein [Clostridium algidicarnis]
MEQMNFNIEDIEKQDEALTEQKDYSFIENTNVTQYKADLAFKTLIDGFDELLYVIPKYQRKYIWSKEQVENLAISLIRGLPIPPIYVYRNEKKQMEILDGQQRILSLFLYYKGKYIKNSTNTQVELQRLMSDDRFNRAEISFEKLLEGQYPLKDVTYELRYREDNKEKVIDISYAKLTKEIRRTVDFTTISVIEIKVDAENEKNRILYKIFENLNSGGTELKNQELRNGVYQCKFYDMLHEINNTNEKWRKIYGEKHKHSRDVELLLRFAAVEHYFKLEDDSIKLYNYENSYPKFLNDFSDEVIHFDEGTVNMYRKNIERFIDIIEVGDRVANLLLESLYLASTCVDGDYIIGNDFCKKVAHDHSYSSYILNSSSTKSKVQGRFNYVYRKLSKYVDGNKGQNIK